MDQQPAPRDARRAKRRPGKAVLILAVLAGCAATLVALLALISTTESPVDGPSAPVLAVALVAAPVVAVGESAAAGPVRLLTFPYISLTRASRPALGTHIGTRVRKLGD